MSSFANTAALVTKAPMAALLVAAVLLLSNFLPARAQSAPNCTELVGGYNTTVLMVADPGSFTGSAEAKWYLANLENPTYVPAGSTICVSRAYGTILGQNVTVVSSGINAQSSALCTFELLQCASHIKDFIYSGTAGFSAAVGGIVNPTNCMETAPPESITRIGDVCVTPYANNWECRLASWSQQCTGYPNICADPQLTDNLTVSGLYGACDFDSFDMASQDLSDEILAAARSNAASFNGLSNSAIVTYQQEYWAAMANGTGEPQYLSILNGLGAPTVYGYDVCAETDGQFFWSGAPWDYSARTYVAYTLSQALGKELTAEEVLAVSAMEAVGVSAMMYKFMAIPGNPQIPYSFVRGNSDYTHLPVRTNGNGVWSEIATVPEVDFTNGYSLAIASYSAVVLDLLRMRCAAAHGANASSCTMKAGGVQYAVS